jgi:hypothetical protein
VRKRSHVFISVRMSKGKRRLHSRGVKTVYGGL